MSKPKLVSFTTGNVTVTAGFRLITAVGWFFSPTIDYNTIDMSDEELDAVGPLAVNHIYSDMRPKLFDMGRTARKTVSHAVHAGRGEGALTHIMLPLDEYELVLKITARYRDNVPGVRDMEINESTLFIHVTEAAPLRYLDIMSVRSPAVIQDSIRVVEGRFNYMTADYVKKKPMLSAFVNNFMFKDSRLLPKSMHVPAPFMDKIIEREHGEVKEVRAQTSVETVGKTEDGEAKTKVTSIVRLGGKIKIRRKE